MFNAFVYVVEKSLFDALTVHVVKKGENDLARV